MKSLFTLVAALASMTVFAGACHADQYQLYIFDGTTSTAQHYAARPGMQFLVAGPGGEVWPYVQTGGYICVNKHIIGKSLNNLNQPGSFITLYPPKPKNDKPRPQSDCYNTPNSTLSETHDVHMTINGEGAYLCGWEN